MQSRRCDGLLPKNARQLVGARVNWSPSIHRSKQEGVRPKDAPRESDGHPFHKKTANLADAAGNCRPGVQNRRAFIRANGHPSKKRRRRRDAARRRPASVQTKNWQLSRPEGLLPSARPKQPGRPPKNGAGRTRRAPEKTQRESAEKQKIPRWTPGKYYDEATTRKARIGGHATGMAHKREGPKLGRPTTEKAHRREGPQPARSKTE